MNIRETAAKRKTARGNTAELRPVAFLQGFLRASIGLYRCGRSVRLRASLCVLRGVFTRAAGYQAGQFLLYRPGEVLRAFCTFPRPIKEKPIERPREYRKMMFCRRACTQNSILHPPSGRAVFRAWRAFGEQDNGGGNAAGHARNGYSLYTFWSKRAILH